MATAGENMADVTGPGRYLAKHWRGGFSLGFAYWINGVAIGLVSFAITIAIGAFIEARAGSLSLTTLRLLIAFIVVGSVVLTVWQFVGIWRSAAAHAGRGGKRMWAVLAQVAVVAGAIRSVAELVNEAPNLAIIFG